MEVLSKLVLQCTFSVMVRNGCEGYGGGHYVICYVMFD